MHLVGERAPAKPEMYADDRPIGIPSGRIRWATPFIVPPGRHAPPLGRSALVIAPACGASVQGGTPRVRMIAPSCGASRLRSECRRSAIVIAPSCGASRLRSEFRMSMVSSTSIPAAQLLVGAGAALLAGIVNSIAGGGTLL